MPTHQLFPFSLIISDALVHTHTVFYLFEYNAPYNTSSHLSISTHRTNTDTRERWWPCAEVSLLQAWSVFQVLMDYTEEHLHNRKRTKEAFWETQSFTFTCRCLWPQYKTPRLAGLRAVIYQINSTSICSIGVVFSVWISRESRYITDSFREYMFYRCCIFSVDLPWELLYNRFIPRVYVL